MTIVTVSGRASELAALDQTDNPFFVWNNKAANATITATSSLPDGAAANALTGTTYDYWLPNVTATTALFQITLAVAETLTFAAIASHNLAALGASIQVQRSTDGGATWVSASTVATPTDNKPIAFRLLAAASATVDYRLRFTGLTVGAPLQVGVIFFGSEIIMPQRIFKGFSPAITPTEIQLQSSVSVGNHLLGSSVVFKGSTIQPTFQYLSQAFVRTTLAGFIPHFNSGKGVFFAWRPTEFAEDIYYAWRSSDAIRPANSDTLAFMQFTANMQIHEP